MRVIHQTTSLCRVCKNGVAANVVADEAQHVWLVKVCAEHGEQSVRLSTDAAWYEATRSVTPHLRPLVGTQKEVHKGCPFDCGPCALHQQSIRLPVVTITSRCNLDCPKCYVHNKNESPFDMSLSDFDAVLGHLKQQHGAELDIINLTGGEPTMHPQFVEFLKLCQRHGVHRVTVCSNGITLARNEALVQELARYGARVALSFDSFDAHTDMTMNGAHLLELKLKCLRLLEKHNVDTTLIPVMAKGLNDAEIGKVIELGLGMKNVRHIEVHTITYTGQGGTDFPRAGRISMVEVMDAIAATSERQLLREDWVPSPHAHPLCYQVAYLLMPPEGGPGVSLARLIGRDAFYECLAERLYLEPSARLESMLRECIDQLWVEGLDSNAATLDLLKRLLSEMFPAEKALTAAESLRVAERYWKAIYIHSHMDEETFDNERIVQCCDSNCYPDGSSIPVCAYNVLYREKEESFMLKPLAWSERLEGQMSFVSGSRRSLPLVKG